MATVKVKVRPSSISNKTGTVYYQVTHRRVVRQISTDIHVHPDQWDAARQHFTAIDERMSGIQCRIRSDVLLLEQIIKDLETAQRQTGNTYSVMDIVNRFHTPQRGVSVIAFMAQQIDALTECHSLGTAKNYRAVQDALLGFLADRDLSFLEITSPFVEQYNEYLQRKGLAKNSCSFHMRTLRAVYNKAVRKGLVEQTYPFRNVYTGVDRTKKRAIDPQTIMRLVGLDLSKSAPLARARDLFLFSLYTRGMAFVDIAFLKWSNIKDGAIYYTRRKTKQPLCVCIESCIKTIIDRYADRESIYLFPILKSEDATTAYSQYRIAMAYYNRLLKRLSKMLGLQQGLSFYSARHSWATIARNNNIPLAIISAGMGHSSERTTQIYLASLENSLIDKANREILKNLNTMYSM